MTDLPAQALIPTNGNGHQEVIAAPEKTPDNFVIPGMEHVPPSELRIPRLQLVQAQSRMADKDGHEGEWFNTVTGEYLRNPELLIIGTAKGRIMFPREYQADNKPLCGSDDGAFPRQEYVGLTIKSVGTDELGDPYVRSVVIPPECDKCPFSQWGPNNEPPECNAVATFAGVDADGLPMLFQLRSSGMKNVPSLKTLLVANGIRKVIKLGAVKETNDSGTYHIAQFALGGKPTKDWQATAIRLAAVGNLAARDQRAAMETQDENGHGHTDTESGEGDEPEYEIPF